MSTLMRIRVWLVLFVVGLVVSGVTAFPLEWESRLLVRLLHADWSPAPEYVPVLVEWLDRVHGGLVATNRDYPFIAYGTDWLAFAHLVIAVAFWGPLKDPVRNVWVVQFGMIACAAVVPLALIAGAVRGIPWWWQLIDMSFGAVGIIPLLLAYVNIRKLAGAPVASAAGGPQILDTDGRHDSHQCPRSNCGAVSGPDRTDAWRAPGPGTVSGRAWRPVGGPRSDTGRRTTMVAGGLVSGRDART